MDSMFMMNTASGLFRTREQLEADDWTLYDNVFRRGKSRIFPCTKPNCSVTSTTAWPPTIASTPATYSTEKGNPEAFALPRYSRLLRKSTPVSPTVASWPAPWLAKINNTTNERTFILI